MKITADTNVLVRAVVDDDPKQGEKARAILASAELIAMPPVVLCEFAWVLTSRYRYGADEIASAIRALIGGSTVETDRLAIEAGLTLLEHGGDFADGVIAFAGEMMGAETFVSFDKRAVRIIEARSGAAKLLA